MKIPRSIKEALLSLIIASTPSSFEYSLEVQIALLRMLKGSRKNKFTFLVLRRLSGKASKRSRAGCFGAKKREVIFCASP
jgi:hypothetical protein